MTDELPPEDKEFIERVRAFYDLMQCLLINETPISDEVYARLDRGLERIQEKIDLRMWELEDD